ncbi:MAG TPA: peptide-methionine (S)-S-oxide reductase MsrA [Vicinamibacterales bacterium]|nr:peptide-methionine (S)-S-oxide reductase MsrA [Vicinamibacterales bacterium]
MNRRRMMSFSGVALALLVWAGASDAVAAVKLPDPAMDDPLASGKSQTLVLAGGCFWGVEEVFRHVRGVTSAVSGYSGGSARNAEYELVSTGTTGHAESVKITYDPGKVSLGQLLKVFFSVVHDPTQINRQGPDIGPQYRSAIFYGTERQQQVSKAYIDQLAAAHVFPKAIATQLVSLNGFYEAEAYHQDFAARNPTHPYIMQVDKPKFEDFKKSFPQLYVK